MILVAPLHLEHIDEFLNNPRDYDREMFFGEGKEKLRTDLVNLYACTMGTAFLTEDARLVSMWFIAQRNGGDTAVVFSCMTALVDEHALGFVRACRLSIDVLHACLHLKRMEAFVDKDYAKSIKWLESLGFSQEGVLTRHEVLAGKDIPIDMSKQVGNHIVMGRVW